MLRFYVNLLNVRIKTPHLWWFFKFYPSWRLRCWAKLSL